MLGSGKDNSTDRKIKTEGEEDKERQGGNRNENIEGRERRLKEMEEDEE